MKNLKDNISDTVSILYANLCIDVQVSQMKETNRSTVAIGGRRHKSRTEERRGGKSVVVRGV